MKKRLLLPPQYLDGQERQPYLVKLMQHQEETAHKLAQRINHIVATCPATAAMLQEIAQLVVTATGADCCCLVTVADEDSTKTVTANWCSDEFLGIPLPNEMLSTERFIMELPVLQCAVEPRNIDEISTIRSSLVTGCQQLPLPIKAVLAIPTRFGGKNNGVVSLIKFEAHDWDESEKHILKTIETACAIAFAQVKQAQLISSQQQYLQKSNQHQSLIKQLTILSRSNLESNQMLQLAIASTAECLQADRGLLILLKYTDPLFRNPIKKQIPQAKADVVSEWRRENNNPTDSTSKSFSLADCGLCQRVFLDAGKPVIINDYTDIQDATPVAPLFAITQMPAVLLMPLENQGKILGFLVLQQTVARNWQQAELNLVEMVCAQVSNAIIQSKTLRQVQTLVDDRTGKLQNSLELHARLREKMRQHVEQLRELNQLKDEFMSNISDRLRYPLTNMMLSIKHLRRPGVSPERQATYLEILENECAKEINLINDLLTLQKLDSDQEPPQVQNIDLNVRIKDLSASLTTKLADKGLSIKLDLPDEPLQLQTELPSFERILQELLNNAYTYSERDTIIDLHASHRVDQLVDQVMIKVTNIGRGISEEEATYIFDRFRRGRGGRWTPGTGLGLALVKSLVQHLNGAIAVESNPIPGSQLSKICFTLTLPQFSDESKPYSNSD